MMTNELTPSSSRAIVTAVMPGNVSGALTTLGIPFRRGDIALMDREFLLYDARVAFKAAIRVAHADAGGSDDAARPLIEAYRLVKRYCTRPVQVVPLSRAEARRAAVDQL